ncbi:MAG TPA: NUDIX domain-containing protein [Nocardioidaceae bacterium]|nr:NUDIX domain-containing protein [Nocardioidaceae bacterium]
MDTSEPAEHVVVAGLLRRDQRALMVHRSPTRRWYPDTWDLPGGHVLDGEPPADALVRELEEELGILAEVTDEPFAHVQGADFRMDIWVIDRWTGEPDNRDSREHDALAWLTAPELAGLRLADPRIPQLLHAALDAGQ